MNIEHLIETLRDAVLTTPHPALILAARHLLSEFDRDLLPDWVAALAGGNTETWEDLLDIVYTEIELEGMTA